jgi:hypothetical protein
MKRSYNSLTSLTSLTSINSRTKIYNKRDFKKYIENIEEDLIKISNDYYFLKNKIINRYDNKINKLYIDLRYRESDFIRLNNKLEYIIKDFNKYKINNYISIINYDFKYTDNIFLYIQIFLYSYTTLIFVILVMPFIKYSLQEVLIFIVSY